ncbi:TrmH family RNA methyltransferase [Granulicella cerasi]|uniref:TrmH family RNA methyltransferase n=1 Tax=Granulicella cerasi TaxID=741063 RepID=A0ABW1Z6E2_9BACT|nr:RNA methyltransferase [Granulicella cerasi]
MQWAAHITSRTNSRVKALRAAFEGKASKPGEFVGLEGEHLLSEAHRSGIALETVFVREGSEHLLERPALAELQPTEWVLLSREVFAGAVETHSPQGIAATMQIPLPSNDGDVALIVEDLQDPGNLGTLLRSVDAFGGGRVLATLATVNPWSPKVIRSSAGSVFRIPMERMILPEIRKRVEREGVQAFAAVAQSERAQSVLETKWIKPVAIMIGNEGAGLSSEALSMATGRVWIPCAVESLNAGVAGSVLLYEAMRQRGAL